MRYLNSLIILAFFVVSLITILQTKIEPAGDIAEYYGITESLIRHQGFDLSPEDQRVLSFKLHPDYFYNPGYYIPNSDGVRYPVHFVFYSLLVLPIRIFLDAIKISAPSTVLAMTNLIYSCLILMFITVKFLSTATRKTTLLLLTLFSPLVFFIIWPGPDIIFLLLLLVSLLYFEKKQFGKALIISIPISWMSQPLIVFSLLYLSLYLIKANTAKNHTGRPLVLNVKSLLLGYGAVLLLVLPYIYNFIIWTTLTPWTLIADSWTKLNGLGIQNMSVKKLFEQFFDLNVGIFWYYPVFTLLGIYSLIKKTFISKLHLIILIATIITAFAFQTNPAWHYGTSGYGPSRHAIFLIPILIYAISISSEFMIKNYRIAVFLVSLQILVLSGNNFLTPRFENTLKHNLFAEFILNSIPFIYNPTPEIFVDRTNHTDLSGPSSAIYRHLNICTKAYIISGDKTDITKECFPMKPTSIIKNGNGTYYNF